MHRQAVDTSRTQRFFGLVLDFGAIAWLCIYPLFATVSVFVLFLLVGQGRELLNILAEEKYDTWLAPQRSIAYVAFAALAIAVWHTSRVLLHVRYHGIGAYGRTNADTPTMAILRKHFPRWLPCVVLLVPSASWFSSGQYWPGFYALLLLFIGIYLLYFRKVAILGHTVTPRGVQTAHLDEVPKQTKFIVGCWLFFAFILVQSIIHEPVLVPRVLGATSVVLMALTGWTIFGGFVLTLWPKAYGWPSMAVAAPMLLAIGSMFTNDNHAPRSYDGAIRISDQRMDAATTFNRWLNARQLTAEQPYPVFIVATEGGGLRAAYWTAAVLGRLQDRWRGDDRFSDHVFAISGVSGGSLGAAAFVSLVARGGPNNAVQAHCRASYEKAADCLLGDDFLAPTLSFLMFPDAIQRFWPVPYASNDRARALELAWESSWRDVMGNDAFANPFPDLWSGAESPRTDVPSLLLNGTVVEDGRRFIVSNINIGDKEFPDAYDAFDPVAYLYDVKGRLLPGKQPKHGVAPAIALSTAAHHSARFTFVSPAARIERTDGGVWGRIVDGGYHENSGAQTTNDLLTSIAPQASARGRAIHLYAILISNAPDQPQLCDDRRKTVASDWFPEVFSPLDALLNARDARGSLARRIFARTLQGESCRDKKSIEAKTQSVFEFHIRSSDAKPTLGWFLSEAADVQMANSLHQGGNATTADAIVSLGIHTPSAPHGGPLATEFAAKKKGLTRQPQPSSVTSPDANTAASHDR